MSLKKKGTKTKRKKKDSETHAYEYREKDERPEYLRLIDQMRTHTPVTTTIPAEEVKKETIIEAVKKANKGAKKFQAFQLDPKSIEVFPHDRAPQNRIIRGRVVKVWEADVWRGDRMTSKEGRVEDMTIRHAQTEQMPYYADLLKDSGLKIDHVRMKAQNLPDGFYVEFLLLELEETKWVKQNESEEEGN